MLYLQRAIDSRRPVKNARQAVGGDGGETQSLAAHTYICVQTDERCPSVCGRPNLPYFSVALQKINRQTARSTQVGGRGRATAVARRVSYGGFFRPPITMPHVGCLKYAKFYQWEHLLAVDFYFPIDTYSTQDQISKIPFFLRPDTRVHLRTPYSTYYEGMYLNVGNTRASLFLVQAHVTLCITYVYCTSFTLKLRINISKL